MIHITVHRSDLYAQRISVKGHADFDEPGRDIICAAVSVLIQTLHGGLEDQLGIKTQVQKVDEQSGIYDFSWNPLEAQQVLVESILASLKLIAKQEPNYVTYSEV